MNVQPQDLLAFSLGVAVATVGPVVLGLALAEGLLTDDVFWVIAPFVVVPLTGPLVGVVVRARVPGRPATAATFAVSAGLALGWILAVLLSGPVDPSPRGEAALVLFFALLWMISVPWWIGPLVVAMAVAWLIVYGFQAGALEPRMRRRANGCPPSTSRTSQSDVHRHEGLRERDTAG